jgi:hypothetical protein
MRQQELLVGVSGVDRKERRRAPSRPQGPNTEQGH